MASEGGIFPGVQHRQPHELSPSWRGVLQKYDVLTERRPPPTRNVAGHRRPRHAKGAELIAVHDTALTEGPAPQFLMIISSWKHGRSLGRAEVRS